MPKTNRKKQRHNPPWLAWLIVIPATFIFSPLGTLTACAIFDLDFFGFWEAMFWQIIAFFAILWIGRAIERRRVF